MPCYEPRDADRDHNRPKVVIKHDPHNSETAQILCELFTQVEKHNPDLLSNFTPEAIEWWETHKLRDAFKSSRSNWPDNKTQIKPKCN